MTKVQYKDGRVTILQTGTRIIFRMCDLTYEDRAELGRAVADTAIPTQAGPIGFLKHQPVEVRLDAIEEILRRSLPLGDECDG